MINSHKTIGVFLCGIGGDYKQELCCSINIAAKSFGFNVLIFNFIGRIGEKYDDYGRYEDRLLDIIPFDRLDGIIFENSNIFSDDIRKKIHRRVAKCSCPVVVISQPCEDFYEVLFDNKIGITEMVEHFAKHHGFTKIGYMSGIEGHPDSVERLSAFKAAMKDNGLPEEGEGIFHGDFWYGRSKEAADFFIERGVPQAIICANDHMAVSLCTEFEKRGVRVPEDVCISGCDGTDEGKIFFPRISTIERKVSDAAYAALSIIDDLLKGKKRERTVTLPTRNNYGYSCGCCRDKLRDECVQRNGILTGSRNFRYHIYDTEAAMLEMNRVSDIGQIADTFSRYCCNFGGFEKFFLFAYCDENGNVSYENAFDSPSAQTLPAIWMDMYGTSERPRGIFPVSEFLPPETGDDTSCYYISHLHFGSHCFGYSAIKMVSDEPFNEFYNIWLLNIAVSLESLLHKNNIRQLMRELESESIHDKLTGMLNRRGFEKNAQAAFEKAKKSPAEAAAIVIDMDRLKHINDVYGHAEGDYAIRALGRIISGCCTEKETAGRTGGDEFYIFAPDYSAKKAELFQSRLMAGLDEFNRTESKPYVLSASCGVYLADISAHSSLEELLKLGDEQMYAVKRVKRSEGDR
ncbi:MAG: GGDEF domain-containing protein [Huintestinicola sp.]|uniref:substrate-binding and GGDEF domain-containing protein n=1 Tax=Huintestinicola sp. TaxID=2981661 RepID=UPI003F0EF633